MVLMVTLRITVVMIWAVMLMRMIVDVNVPRPVGVDVLVWLVRTVLTGIPDHLRSASPRRSAD